MAHSSDHMGRAKRWASAAAMAWALAGCDGPAADSTSGGAAGDTTGATTATGAAGGGGQGGGQGGGPVGGSGTAGQGGATGPCQDDGDCQADPSVPACDVPTGQCVQCLKDADCALHPHGPICNLDKKVCVSCLVNDDPALDCGLGQYCDDSTGQCEVGCTGDEDCPSQGGDLSCDLPKHACVGCITNQDCPLGELCYENGCVPGCQSNQPCPDGQTCCSNQCADLQTDESNCGACGYPCYENHNIPACDQGKCLTGVCYPNFADCNKSPLDGCEHNALADGDCVCEPGLIVPCYFGAPGTLGVGTCAAGSKKCDKSGLYWGPCIGQVLPKPEICANGSDEDCDGIADNPPDNDNDGFTICEGDCDDFDERVNPGAMELTFTVVDDDGIGSTPPIIVPGGNGLDDDCNPATPDDVDAPPCSAVEELTGVTPLALAHAMDLCQLTQASPPLAQKTWGLISAEFRATDGTVPDAAALAAFADQQAAVLTGFGSEGNAGVCDGSGAKANAPFLGPTLAALSTGRMRDPGQADYMSPEPGTEIGTPSACPADYLAAHGGQLPSNSGCLGVCPSGTGCFDGISLRLVIRVPTNAASFTHKFQVFSAEYAERLCSPYNDVFLSLTSSLHPAYPMDKNIAYDGYGNPLTTSSMFFRSCSPAACFPCLLGTSALSCTGHQGGVGASGGWLAVEAPIVPGETITMDLQVFDVSDAKNDTQVLLDAFQFWPPFPPIWDH